MQVQPISNSAEQNVRKSTMAFLEGEQSLEWITGILAHSGLSNEETDRILSSLGNYGNPYRSNVLFNWLAQTRENCGSTSGCS